MEQETTKNKGYVVTYITASLVLMAAGKLGYDGGLYAYSAVCNWLNRQHMRYLEKHIPDVLIEGPKGEPVTVTKDNLLEALTYFRGDSKDCRKVLGHISDTISFEEGQK